MGKTKRLDAVMLSALAIALFVAFLLVVTPAKPVKASTTKIENFIATDDAQVESGNPDNPSHGLTYNIYNGYYPDNGKERIYLKFDLGKISSSAAINSAVLKLISKFGPSADPSYSPTFHFVDALPVTNDTWSESTITWNNAPSPDLGTILDNDNFQADDYLVGKTDRGQTSSTGQYAWYTWDVKSFVASQIASGDGIITICLKRHDVENAYESSGWFYSKDAGAGYDDWLPRIEVSWTSDVGISISPSTQTGTPRENLSYTVTVKNDTGSSASFNLTVDNEWVTSIPSTTGSIPDGGTKTVTLNVICPTVCGFQDTITVTASLQGNPSVSGSSTCTAVTDPIYTEGDTWVLDAQPTWKNDWDEEIIVGNQLYNGNPEICRGYWRMNLGSIPSGATIDNVVFSVFTHYGGENGPVGGVFDNTTVTVTLHEVANWEDGIDWNTAPPPEDPIGSVVVPETNDRRYSWNVTSYVASQFADGYSTVSFCMVSANEGVNAFVPWTAIDSEYWDDGQQSYLIVSYTGGGGIGGVNVLITPSSRSGSAGSTLTYTVTVTNTGDAQNTFTLTPSDNAGWGPTIPPTPLTVPRGEYRTATLSVTIPIGAQSGARDNVRVTATGTGASAQGSCLAIVSTTIPPVEVSILPISKNGLSGSILTYTVTVKNTSTASDTYSLAKSDSTVPSWPSSLSKMSVGPLAPGAQGTTQLSVTISADTAEGVSHTITVTATSPYTAATADASCVVLALGPPRPGVWVGTSPSSRENIPGGTLRYFVTVTNMGNVTDDYTLSATDTLGWGPTLPSSIADVARNEDRTVTLTVGIPDNAADNDSSRITVTATSGENTTVKYNATCTARCVIAGVTSITISPSRFTLFPGYSGQVQSLTATLRASDNLLPNKQITWSVTAGAGSVGPSSGTTDALGRVYVVYTAPAVTDNTPQVTVTASFASDNQYQASSGTSLGVPAARVVENINASTGGTVVIYVIEINVTENLLVIPPDALSEDTAITVVQAPPLEGLSNYKMVSHIFNIGPSGTTFATPSTLTLPYNENELPAGVSEDDLAVYYRTSAGGGWERVGGTVDTTANTVSVQIDHLSEYAVMASTGVVVVGGELPLLPIGVIIAVILIIAVIAIFIRRR